ncbi:MAG TPA: DSD1 family PLP-dependent enzyme [Candidatus Aquilonibacter sp.]|nr:DSD1 family PLP-dependent enzyme [Candidatus Aquilonibacter sp.]
MNDETMHRSLIGRSGGRRELNTPVLVIDVEVLERNIARMARLAKQHGLGLRPHVKTHKSVEIGRLQRDAGATGFCCAKLGEAEVMADGGIVDGLLLTSPVVSDGAIRRLIELNARTSGLMCVVDHPENVKALGEAARAAGKSLRVLIDIDPGIHRTGVTSPEAAVDLLQEICAQQSLIYSGVQFYCGREQHIEGYADRRAVIQQRTDSLQIVIEALKEQGGAPSIITGGGTGTHRIDTELGILTELQVGSYIFMDSQYAACDITGSDEPPYEFALMVDVRVISANSAGMRTVDAGYKALATDGGIPRVLAGMAPETEYLFMGDEHGLLTSSAELLPRIGERVILTAPHCDPTVNLYDFYHVVRGDTLVAIWPVDARGRSR